LVLKSVRGTVGYSSKKIHTSPTNGLLQIPLGEGSRVMEIQAEGAVEPKKIPKQLGSSMITVNT